ncbi:hypothetical protein FA95DRAFT_1613031 [Auriscalpium vulgare]|uniref:Uncharacterized protein n=1 Tax=Auriscalpium vulgare TaxID=40419 RepID=A0ACB8R4S3_9AGAM|nr:hypothetical protein FA95DRAFT_1613031 [Auriscalpium vulgare]
MQSRILLNVEVSPGRVIVLTLDVSPGGVQAYTSQHDVPDPYLDAWRPASNAHVGLADVSLSNVPPHSNVPHANIVHGESDPTAAIDSLIRRLEISLRLGGGEGGWSEVAMEEEVERLRCACQ